MPLERNGSQSTLQPRASRFAIHTPVRYREAGAAAWHEGKSVNISRTGILFHAGQRLEPKTMLEMRIIFPPELTGKHVANVVCWGPVIRIEEPADASLSGIAAAIVRYRFQANNSAK